MPQLDLYSYLFGEFTVGCSFILLYSLFFLILFKFWVLFFQNNDFKLSSYSNFNFFKNFNYNTVLNFFRIGLSLLSGSNKNKLNIVVNIFFLKEYASFLLFLLTAFVISSLLFFLANYLNDKFLYKEKVSSYECGFEPFSDARAQVNIHFYIVGLLFVIFDVEVIYFLPWACNLGSLGAMGYVSILIFNFFLVSGFVYEMNRGVFDWAANERVLSSEDKLKIVATAFPEMYDQKTFTFINDSEKNSEKELKKKNLLNSFVEFFRANKLLIGIVLCFLLILLTIFICFYFFESILFETDADLDDFFFDRRRRAAPVKRRIKIKQPRFKNLTIISIPHKTLFLNPRILYTDKYRNIHKYIHIAGVFKKFVRLVWIPFFKPVFDLIFSIFFYFFDILGHDIKLRLFSILSLVFFFLYYFEKFFDDEDVEEELHYHIFTGEPYYPTDTYDYLFGWLYFIFILLAYAGNYPNVKFFYLYKLYFVLESTPPWM